ncbi:TetR family transcriptional regulator [Paenibacillus sp. 598K]|uniref:TetR/AcrR family transcriptional regulator n=1 Tax=Paenibacillus sp. 598K TaxID=1117987 RepID=UPI000FFA4FBA|nr:TetR/AcrR family transcriptional regulator [Paenibacillus sp. 598K]GBF75635.1 TetR family transcriptional regulator [Paenibacillus sp. 598K]
MPYPEDHKLKVRGRIIESAARAFRANGLRDISVPVIMKGAGLTHGGFYAHFTNKDALIMETCRYAIGDTMALLQAAAAQTADRPPIETVIRYYLSPEHRDQTETGCILPALSGEISRASEELRDVFTAELQRMIDFLCELGRLAPSTGRALLSLLVGTLLLARSVPDRDFSDSLLTAGREQALAMLRYK